MPSKRWLRKRYKEFDVRKGDQPILTGYFGGLLAIAVPTYVALHHFRSYELFTQTMINWLFLFGLILSLFDFWVRRKELKALKKPRPLPFSLVLKGAFLRWVMWWLILGAGYAIYHLIAHYQDPYYASYKVFYRHLLFLWLVGGIPLFVLSLRRRYGTRWDFKDPSVLVFLLLRRMVINFQRGHSPFRSLLPFFRPLPSRMIWFGLMVKGFFLPLMTTFFLGNARNYVQALWGFLNALRAPDPWGSSFYVTTARLYEMCYQGLFLVDVSLAVVGYAITTRFLDNGTRKVEYTALGWWACILCYKPFNDLTSWYLRWPDRNLYALPDTPWKVLLMSLVILLLGIYVWATLAFGVRFSNLTHRGIFTQGPYRFIRHPAYISKNLSWWIEHIPGITSFAQALWLAGWNLIYFTRALTEERLLRSDPAYQKYCEKVRWRFIPGIF